MSMVKRLVIVGSCVVALGAWYAFRPERLIVDSRVNEAFPVASAAPAEPVLLASGRFHAVAHKSVGQAAIYRLPDGSRVLRFTQFETSNGPDVQIYLGVAADASDNDTVTSAGFYNLGPMKGNVGDQNYAIPAELDLARYKSVTIWCRRFGVNFGTAPLATQP